MARIGWILRGQSAGLMHWKVFTTYPTNQDFSAALGFELERHGLKIERLPIEVAEGEEPRTEIRVTPKERWVQAVEVEIVGLDAAPEPTAEEKAARTTIMRGRLSDDDARRIAEGIVSAPPGTAAASSAAPQIVGEGRVVNPGEPGYVESPTKYPGDPRDRPARAREVMTISSEDVADARSVLGPEAK